MYCQDIKYDKDNIGITLKQFESDFNILRLIMGKSIGGLSSIMLSDCSINISDENKNHKNIAAENGESFKLPFIYKKIKLNKVILRNFKCENRSI